MRRGLFLLLTIQLSSCNWIELIGVDSNGVHGQRDHRNPALSADARYVAFATQSALVPEDTNTRSDIYVRDTLLGLTTRVSVDSNGNQGLRAASLSPSISADGRYVAFASSASTLVADDNNDVMDVFVHDRATAQTTRVSVDSAGEEGDDSSDQPQISADGRYVMYLSRAGNLVADDTNGLRDVFVHDRQQGSTRRVSVDSEGNQTIGEGSNYGRISGDGRYIVFYTRAPLVEDDTNFRPDVYRHDQQTGVTIRVSVDSAGNQGNAESSACDISDDGRYVAFFSVADNLVEDHGDSIWGIFVHDVETGLTTMASLNTVGNPLNGFSEDPVISGDGRFVAFESRASNLNDIAPPTVNRRIMVHDRKVKTTFVASQTLTGALSRVVSATDPVLSADGRYVAFESVTPFLVPGENNGREDVFLKAIPPVAVDSVAPAELPIGATTRVTISGRYFLPGTFPTVTGADVRVENLQWLDENTMTADIVVANGARSGARDLAVLLPGTGPGANKGSAASCEACLTLF